MHTPLFYLPYNVITFLSTVAAYPDNADRTENSIWRWEDNFSRQAPDFYSYLSKVKPLAIFAGFFFSPNGIDPLSGASLLHLIVLDILNSRSYNSLIHPEISALRWLMPMYFKFGIFISLAVSSSCDWVKSKAMSHLLLYQILELLPLIL